MRLSRALVTRLASASTALVLTLHAAPALAQGGTVGQSTTSGFWIGGGLEGASILANDALNSATDSGGGLGLEVGYGLNQRWSLYAALAGASMSASDFSGNYSLGHFDLGTRIHFAQERSRVRPFLHVGLSGRAVSQDYIVGSRSYRIEASGAGLSFGGGLNAHFNKALAFSAGLTWAVGNFSTYKVNRVEVFGESLGATSARAHLGLVYFPGGRR